MGFDSRTGDLRLTKTLKDGSGLVAKRDRRITGRRGLVRKGRVFVRQEGKVLFDSFETQVKVCLENC